VLLPLTHVHSFEDGLNSQRSLRSPAGSPAPPQPPKSHRFPLPSIQLTEPLRAPGTLLEEAEPKFPYTPLAPAVLLPLIQVHSLPVVGLPTTIDTLPDLEVSCVEVAVMVAVPVPAGVNTPEDVIVPSVAPQVTAELNDPVPCTVAVQVDVCVVRMDAGEQTTETEVIVDGAVTVTVALPDLVES